MCKIPNTWVEDVLFQLNGEKAKYRTPWLSYILLCIGCLPSSLSWAPRHCQDREFLLLEVLDYKACGEFCLNTLSINHFIVLPSYLPQVLGWSFFLLWLLLQNMIYDRFVKSIHRIGLAFYRKPQGKHTIKTLLFWFQCAFIV